MDMKMSNVNANVILQKCLVCIPTTDRLRMLLRRKNMKPAFTFPFHVA